MADDILGNKEHIYRMAILIENATAISLPSMGSALNLSVHLCTTQLVHLAFDGVNTTRIILPICHVVKLAI